MIVDLYKLLMKTLSKEHEITENLREAINCSISLTRNLGKGYNNVLLNWPKQTKDYTSW